MAKNSGGHQLAAMLQAEGVRQVFGIVDGTYLMLLAGCAEHAIDILTPRHEATALHAAGAYARISGHLGVALASNGPGVANALAGVAVEQGEGNRVLLITSSRRPQIAQPDRGGAYQCFDQTGAIGALCKWSATVKSADRLVELTHKALRACYSGRPGVVHLDVPENLINGKFEQAAQPLAPARYRRTRPLQPGQAEIEAVVELLQDAALPALHVGGGAIHAGAAAEVAELAELLHAPITTSWSGRGIVAESHPLIFPIVHIEAVNAVRNAADVMLCLGSDLGETDWWGKPPYWRKPSEQRFVQVDIDDSILGRNHVTDLAIQADLRAFLQALIAALRQQPEVQVTDPERKRRVARLTQQRDAHRNELDQALADEASPLLTAHVAPACQDALPEATTIVIDGGNTAVWANFYTRLRRPYSLLGTPHFGHLGAGPGQAIGAALARPDAPVCCIIGDGAMGFHPQEVETAVRHDLNILFLVCCDRQWGMVKLTERVGLDPLGTLLRKGLGAPDRPADPSGKHGALDGVAQAALKPVRKLLAGPLQRDRTINADLRETRYDRMAEAMGANGLHADSPQSLAAALRQARQAGGCCVIHVDVDAEKHLWAPGLSHFKAMHQEPAG